MTRLRIDDATLQKFFAVITEHGSPMSLRNPLTCTCARCKCRLHSLSRTPLSASGSYNCIRHFCNARHFLYIVHAHNIRAACDADCDRCGSALHSLVSWQIKCKPNE